MGEDWTLKTAKPETGHHPEPAASLRPPKEIHRGWRAGLVAGPRPSNSGRVALLLDLGLKPVVAGLEVVLVTLRVTYLLYVPY